MAKAKLFLIPVPLGDNETIPKVLPLYVLDTVRSLKHFIVEKNRTARRFVSAAGHPMPIESLHFYELDKHNAVQDIKALMKPLFRGESMGLMSEAGTPAVADPGSKVVEAAHQNSVEVVPLTGPNSLLLALMASGLNGQGFVFHGYLPVKHPDRIKKLKEIEKEAKNRQRTQIFIETPYRNMQLFQTMINSLHPQTKLCIACDLTLPGQWIATKTITQWKKETVSLHKRPTVFLIL